MSVFTNLTILNRYKEYVMEYYDNFPHGRYVSLVLIRKTESEAIFRTEGSGEGLVKDTVIAGMTTSRNVRLRRVVISKRKQTAVERRTGRELLRELNLLKMGKNSKKEEQICSLNTNAPCGKCIDCMVYGYAVGGGGAQKSRVMTDDAYSLGSVAQVTGRRTFNATFDNGTMRNPFNGEPSTSINEDEFVLPETHFLDIETLKDVTLGELQYVIGNILRSNRYGAITSRLGRVHNTLAAIIFSDTEVFSNLELTQCVYDLLPRTEGELDFPLNDEEVQVAVSTAIDALLPRLIGRLPVVLRNDAQGNGPIKSILDETVNLYRDRDTIEALLTEVDHDYEKNRN